MAFVQAVTAETERVVVTGSYVPTAETESALPVTVYSAEFLRKQGANTPVEGLRQLPSFLGNTATENDSNGGNGEAFINLRALGPSNTLTLINGRRAFALRNVNAIPIGALSRTEVLKDGASAIYGSDAVAGVVNFILLNGPGEKPYEGAELDITYGNTTDHDARVLQIYLRGGVATEKVAIAAAGEYYDRANLYSRDREIAKSADNRSLGGFNIGSATFSGRVSVAGRGQLVLIDSTNNAPGSASYRTFDPAGAGTDPARFNFRTFTPAIPAVTKYQYYVTGRYKVFGEALQIYGDLLYAKTKQDNGLAPSPFAIPLPRYANTALGIFNGRDSLGVLNGSLDNSNAVQLAIMRNSPFNPFGNSLTQVRYRLAEELSNRRHFFDFDYYRYVAGINGDFSFKDNSYLSSLGYDAGIVSERTERLQTNTQDATRAGIYREILAGNFNPFIGQDAPISGTVPTYAGGVPTGLTAFYDNGAAAQRASYIGKDYTTLHDFLVDGRVYGNVAPHLYQGGIGFNLGVEFRQSRSAYRPDPVEVSADPLGFTASRPTKYKQKVSSIFAETTIPLVISTMKVPGVRSLEIDAAYRYEKFDDTDLLFGTVAGFNNGGTPRLSLRYQPVSDVTFRASWGRSFRSPSPDELFASSIQTFGSVFDPVAGGFTTPVNGIFGGGNPTLKPEKTDSYTAGIVITPALLPGFSATVDFYQLYTTDVILDSFTVTQVLVTANGNAGGGPNAPFAQFVHRSDGPTGPQTGEILSVDTSGQNASKRLVNGMDITATYELPLRDWGKAIFSLGYNYFFTWKIEAFKDAGTTNFLGDYSGLFSLPLTPGAIPYHKGFLRAEWQWKAIDFVATTNYISSFNDDSTAVAAATRIGGTPTSPQYDVYRRVSDYITLDMQSSYEFRKPPAPPPADSKSTKNIAESSATVDHGTFLQRMLWNTRITVGVNNVFDRNPPTALGAFNDNYDTSLYSIRNRYYYVSLNKRF